MTMYYFYAYLCADPILILTMDAITPTRPLLPGWARAVLALFAFVLCVVVVQPAFQQLYALPLVAAQPWLGHVAGWAEIVLPAFITVGFFRRYLDRQSFASIGFSACRFTRDFLLGGVVATLLYAVGFGVLWISGQIRVVGIGFSWLSLLNSFVMFVAVAFSEEMLCRGYLLNNMMQSMNRYLALLVTALIFSLLHLFNPGFSFFSFLNLLLAGILLGASYIYTRNLWFPVSLHLFWNFIQGVLGFNVSGGEWGAAIIRLARGEDNLLNGGRFGFEGSLVCTCLMLLIIPFILRYYRKKALAGEYPDNASFITRAKA